MQQSEIQKVKYYCNKCHLSWRHDSEQQNDGKYIRSVCPNCKNEASQLDAQNAAYNSAKEAIDNLIKDSYSLYREYAPNDAGQLTFARVFAWTLLEVNRKF